ncbi:hypothetical protein SDC9_54250 [bioreactor metagenome]|uniref:Uncharacterized protein n=1 Tax=bioreactor metagenome TaxID=1076179 RepID=A0A644WVX7_9ZZZZ
MPRGEGDGTEGILQGIPEAPELQDGVAVGAGIGGFPREIAFHEGGDDRFPEFLLKVGHVVGYG